MLYWIEATEFDYENDNDNDNRRFKKLDLKESDSEMFIKRIKVFKFGLKSFLYLFILCSLCIFF